MLSTLLMTAKSKALGIFISNSGSSSIFFRELYDHNSSNFSELQMKQWLAIKCFPCDHDRIYREFGARRGDAGLHFFYV